MTDELNRLVSQSEVDSFLGCERKHYYAFGEHLQRKIIAGSTNGGAMFRGTLGHSALANYYQAIIDGDSIGDAKAKMLATVMEAALSENADYDMIGKLHKLLSGYVDFYIDEFKEWQPLAVEHEFRDEDFPFRPDYVKRHRRSGQVVVVDHKFLYNFYTGIYIPILPQLPKYTGALQRLGYDVHHAEYNMIRHRDNAKEKYSRLEVQIPPSRIETYRHEQFVASQRILARKSQSLEEWEATVLRAASSFNCPNCPFLVLCISDLDKQPGGELLRSQFFEENTYGYQQKEEDSDE